MKLTLEDKVGIGVVSVVLGGLAFAFSCAFGAWGSRGIKTDFTSQYNGKPLAVQHEDIRMGPDNYWILLDNRDKIYKGTIVSDDGKEIKVSVPGVDYSVKDYKPSEE